MDRSLALVTKGRSTIEVAVDRGEVRSETRSVPICEIELELRRGEPAALFALARRLDAAAAVRLGVLSKAECGYRLLDRHEPGIAKAEPVALHKQMPVAAAFRAIAWSCIRHFRLNETILTATGNPEALHQARVALRRLRSALLLFRSVLQDERFAGLRNELRWLAAVLGEARDIDVLIKRTPEGQRAEIDHDIAQ